MTTATTIKPNGNGTAGSWIAIGAASIYEAIDEGLGSTDNGSSYISANAATTCFVLLEDTPSEFESAATVTIDLRAQHTTGFGDFMQIYLQIVESDETTAITDEVLFDPIAGFTTISESLTITGTNDKAAWDGARVKIRSTGSNGFAQISTLDVVLDYDAGAHATPILVPARQRQLDGVRYTPPRIAPALLQRVAPPPTGEEELHFAPFVRRDQPLHVINRTFLDTRCPSLVPMRSPLPPTGEEPGESTAPLLGQFRYNTALAWADVHFREERRRSAQLLATMASPPLPPPPPTPAPTAAVGSGPFMGGHTITRAYWLSHSALRVEFSSSYGTTYHYQLYAGRCLIGATSSTSQRLIVGHLQPSAWPPHLTLLAVDTDQRLTDYGDTLPPRPYNRVKLQFTAASWPADSKYIDVTGSTAAGGAVVDSNLIERVLYDTDRQYTVLTKPLPGTGVWSFEVFGRDGRPASGNAGDVLELSQAVLAHPPDVALASDGSRLSVSVESQTATVTFTYPS